MSGPSVSISIRTRLSGTLRPTAIRLRNWVEGPARSEQKIGPGRGHRNEPGVNEPANATPGQGTRFPNALKGRRNRTSQGGLFSPAPPLGRRDLRFAHHLRLHSGSRLPQATIHGSFGAEAPPLIQHLYPLHCTQRGTSESSTRRSPHLKRTGEWDRRACRQWRATTPLRADALHCRRQPHAQKHP